MNNHVHERAKEHKAADRDFLDSTPEGVPLSALCLEDDKKFCAMDEERRRLIDENREGNAARISELETAMNNHVHERAKEHKAADRDFLDSTPEGVPLSALCLEDDKKFCAMDEERRRLIDENREGNAARISELETAMNNHVHERAKEHKAADRDFLDSTPEGVPLSALCLEDDKKFCAMDEERRRLIDENREGNAARISELETAMNNHVHERAKEHKAADRDFLDPTPEGVPLSALCLEDDKKFCAMDEERRRLIDENREGNAARISELGATIGVVGSSCAKDVSLFDGLDFVDMYPLGIPLRFLGLENDVAFAALVGEGRDMLRRSFVDGQVLSDLEDRIASYVFERAKDFILENRGFLDPMPCGIPLSAILLDEDIDFSRLEKERFSLVFDDGGRNAARISELEKLMNERCAFLARALLNRGRRCDVLPLYLLPLDSDEVILSLEDKLRSLYCSGASCGDELVLAVENEIACRVNLLASYYIEHELDFLDCTDGIPLSLIRVEDDAQFCSMRGTLRELLRSPVRNAEAIEDIRYAMNNRVRDLGSLVLWNDRSYLNPMPRGVPLGDLPLDNALFRELELKRKRYKEDDPLRNASKIRDLEAKLNDHAERLATLMLTEERSFLGVTLNGVPLNLLPLDTDDEFREMERQRRKLLRRPKKDEQRIKALEERMKEYVLDLAIRSINWQDVEFHEANKHLAQEWPRICELYPEGKSKAVMSDFTRPDEVASAPGELAYLAPFIAALSQHPPLLHRLLETRSHPGNGRYTFIFFDPNSNPVRVDIDDRVPVDARYEPKYTRVPQRSWYPLLLEKAYAKFVGGYAKLEQCTPHETLRDLTGRPVLHIPFDERLADAANIGDFRSVVFWRGIIKNLSAGDVITCITNDDVPDGLHPLCSYALLSVIETVPESSDPADIVVKLHNCYYDEPRYEGPLSSGDARWTDNLKRVCRYSSDEEALFLPLPVFLRNFSSMQRCHINCGDRLTAPGEWSGVSCGGNPKFTSFRNNPIFLVENKSSRAATILAELRHHSYVFVDADGVNHYHRTGIALLQHRQTTEIITCFLTNSTHRFLQKGMMLDTREVCAQMEIPPNTTCYLVPYTLKRGSYGKFNISIYPGEFDISLVPLGTLFSSHVILNIDVVLKHGNHDGRRVDFMVSEPCDVHLLLHQNKVTDPSVFRKGNVLAENYLMMFVNDESMSRIATTGCPTNAREHSLAFELPTAGRYSIMLESLNKCTSGDCPCTLSLCTPNRANTKLFPLPPTGTQPLLPAIAPRQHLRQPLPHGRRMENRTGRNGTMKEMQRVPPVSLVPTPPKIGAVMRHAGN
uniref:Putative calpain n=1 Tax=Trypanosoma congolense (strain IL3000) TaxID=1068625 RepID=G0UZA2_TRYCI|nr:putative calpain [Trypanosoma congolense IL3000]